MATWIAILSFKATAHQNSTQALPASAKWIFCWYEKSIPNKFILPTCSDIAKAMAYATVLLK